MIELTYKEMITIDDLIIETNVGELRLISSEITMLGEIGMHEQLYAQIMGWA